MKNNYYCPVLGVFKYGTYVAVPYKHFETPLFWNVLVSKKDSIKYIPVLGISDPEEVAFSAMSIYDQVSAEEKKIKKILKKGNKNGQKDSED